MIILIIQVRKQDVEKLNGFSEIIQLVRGRTGILNPIHWNYFAFGIILFSLDS